MTTTAALASPARETMILGQLGQVRLIARQLQRRVPPNVTLDDLISAGTLGLIQAVDCFDPARHIQLKTYAKRRIRGAMLDLLRQEDPLSRRERQRLRQERHTPTEQPAASVSLVRLDATLEASLPAPDRSPLEQAIQSEQVRQFTAACQQLPSTQQHVLALHSGQGWTQQAVREQLGCSAGRVAQLKARAIRTLQQKLTPPSAQRAA